MLIQGEEVTCKKVRTGEFKALQVHVKDCGKNCNLVHSVLPSTLGKNSKLYVMMNCNEANNSTLTQTYCNFFAKSLTILKRSRVWKELHTTFLSLNACALMME